MLYYSDLRGCRGKSSHPCLEHDGPELEWVFPNKDEVDDLKDDELVEEDANTGGDEELGQLGHHYGEVFNLENLGSDDAGDTDGRDPHDGSNHLHHGVVNDGKPVHQAPGLLTHLAQSNTKEQREENDPEHVGGVPKAHKSVSVDQILWQCNRNTDLYCSVYFFNTGSY